jgi:hypothetical protein
MVVVVALSRQLPHFGWPDIVVHLHCFDQMAHLALSGLLLERLPHSGWPVLVVFCEQWPLLVGLLLLFVSQWPRFGWPGVCFHLCIVSAAAFFYLLQERRRRVICFPTF